MGLNSHSDDRASEIRAMMDPLTPSSPFLPYQSPSTNTTASTSPVDEKSVTEIWTKSDFVNRGNSAVIVEPLKTWTCESVDVDNEGSDNNNCSSLVESSAKEETMEKCNDNPEPESPSYPSHHARRPMNAFLIFCKKHRPVVRKEFPNLENRGVTRILGEWWALLDASDKDDYTNLAKEYKDAFFCAHPNFQWYKLPAPPLRTLPQRPNNTKADSNYSNSPTNTNQQIPPEFTPGKLADESQLGMLSSLLNNNNQTVFTASKDDADLKIENPFCNNNNYVEADGKEVKVHEGIVDGQLAENPYQHVLVEGDKSGSETTLEGETVLHDPSSTFRNDLNDFDSNGYKDTRKSVRKSKGNRYAIIMANGRLLKNKRDKREQPSQPDTKYDLNNTIRRLEERIKSSENIAQPAPERTRTTSEMSEGDDYAKAIPSFDLDRRISALPCLSYESYQTRKRDSKKRKFVRSKPDAALARGALERAKAQSVNAPTGSRKRKNKNNITHLEKRERAEQNVTNRFEDLSGLATLAEIAAIKPKINDAT